MKFLSLLWDYFLISFYLFYSFILFYSGLWTLSKENRFNFVDYIRETKINLLISIVLKLVNVSACILERQGLNVQQAVSLLLLQML